MHIPASAVSARPHPGRPLLKWAGGKRQLIPAIGHHYPDAFDRYVEPFLGSGAVFFDLLAAGRLQGRRVRLADVNADLIGCYQTLRDDVEGVIQALERLEREHRKAGDACYYDVRDRRFNPRRAAQASGETAARRALAASYSPDLAAMLIFLNRTGFNGLFRLNRQGGFNVPAGRYSDPRICDPDHLRAVAEAFRQSGLTLELAGFETTVGEAGPGDFVYCDPPYAPLSRTASFANYTADGFGPADQARLAEAVIAACNRGASVVISNSSAPDILALYSSARARAAGLVVRLVPARRAINSRSAARGPINEVIVTNVRLRSLPMVPRPAMLRARRPLSRRPASGVR
jgi:DNA adenine methylase